MKKRSVSCFKKLQNADQNCKHSTTERSVVLLSFINFNYCYHGQLSFVGVLSPPPFFLSFFVDVSTGWTEEKEKYNFKLPHLHRCHRFIKRRREFCGKAEVKGFLFKLQSR